MITVYLEGSEIVVKPSLPRGPWEPYYSAVSGMLYDSSTRTNRCRRAEVPLLQGVLRRLGEEGFSPSLSPGVLALLGEDETGLEPPQGPVTPYPFQREGIAFLASRKRAMLLDDMGLGKTLQALLSLPSGTPTLVVCPRVARGVWEAEAGKLRPDLEVVQLSPSSFRWPHPGELCIGTYETVPHEWALPTSPEGVTVIVDEAHNVRNTSSSRYKRVKSLLESAARAYLLTATPLENRPPDLWNLATLLGVEREAFGSRKHFYVLFARESATEWGVPLPGAAKALRCIGLRRTKAEVMGQIPQKVIQVVPVDIDLNSAEARDVDQAHDWLLATDHAMGFGFIMKARAILARRKIPAMLELVEDLEAVNEPALVFSCHKAPIEALETRPGWRTITGDTTPEARTQAQEDFQAGRLFGLGLTIGAGGTALTLTAAHHVVFVDREWNPGRNHQAEDRAVRIGQDKVVTIHRLVASHPLDRRVEDLIEEKTTSIEGSVEAM